VSTDALVGASWIAEQVDDRDVRIVEVDVSPASYEEGHIPGAVLWNAYSDLRHDDYSPATAEQFTELLEASGISPTTTVVLYGYAAHLGYWLLSARGHRDVRLMDGGREQWEQAGEWSTEVPSLEAVAYEAPPAPIGLSRGEVEEVLADPEALLLDVRTPEEYDGERFWPSGASEGAGRAGHMPGAVLLPVDLLRTADRALRSAEEIGQALSERGAARERRIVLYCTIGNRAAVAWFAMTQLLGYADVGVYYGSWSEWGSLPDTPVET
jgi:thiosulfate/3-mercaptopyruvate sulfurtransferase